MLYCIGPRHARQCNSVAWNPSDGHLLASALDKHRADHAVQVWDVQKYPIQQRQFPTHFVSSQPSAEYSRPVVEFGLADVAHSLAWFKENPRILVVGVNNKQLRIVDIRGLTSLEFFHFLTFFTFCYASDFCRDKSFLWAV